MEYEIIATLGPTSSNSNTWQDMLHTGCTAFRLNTSHLDLPGLKKWMNDLKAFFEQTGRNIPVVLDLQGSKWRLGSFPELVFEPGQSLVLCLGDKTSEPDTLPVPHPDFFRAAQYSSQYLMLNDGKNRLKIIETGPKEMRVEVQQGGFISSRKGVTFTETSFRSEGLSEKDLAIVAAWSTFPRIRFAVSYVRDEQEMQRFRKVFPPQSYLIAKLERETSMLSALEISQTSDELWVCRGDLGAEMGFPGMAVQVNQFEQTLARIKRPVFMAGQVLEHLTENATPTRSEVCYLYNTLSRGYKGVVLSDETAIGQDPLNACKYAAMYKPTKWRKHPACD